MQRNIVTLVAVALFLSLIACDDNRAVGVQSQRNDHSLEATAATDSSGFTNNLDHSSEVETDTVNTLGTNTVNPATGTYSADTTSADTASGRKP